MPRRRPLDSNEQLLLLCDSVSPFNVVFVLRTLGRLVLDDCRRALADTQRLHPLLQIKIARSASGQDEFIKDESLEIPLVCLRDVSDSLETYIETELMTRIDTEAGPLIRVTLIQHDDNLSTLLFTTHHAIGDGLSSCFLARDFLQILARDKTVEEGGRLPDSMTRRLPARLRGLRGVFLHTKQLAYTVMSSLRNGAPASLSLIDADLTKRIPMIALRTADAIQVKKILASCKAHGCSMHGALGAALLQSLKDNIVVSGDTDQIRPVTVQLLSPVNIRTRLNPPVEDEFGLYVATQAVDHCLTTDKKFWSLAQEISLELRRHINADGPLAFMPLASRYLVKIMLVGDSIFGRTRFSQWLCSTFPPCVALSNLGSIDVPSDYGDIRLDGMGFFGSLSAMGSISSFTLTFREKLSWNFVAMSPSLDRKHLEAVADDSMLYLLENTL